MIHSFNNISSTPRKNINAALIPNDENGAPIIHYLQGQGIKAKTFPTTGEDATLTGVPAVRGQVRDRLHGGRDLGLTPRPDGAARPRDTATPGPLN
jgi:hypothetical protein